MISRSLQMLGKSTSALISALEAYNKPDVHYRGETFAILSLNAWELLFKAKVLYDNHNNPRALFVYERKRTKSGDWSNRTYIKRNRAGNPYTKALIQIVNDFDQSPQTRLPQELRKNLEALIEIRDNAVHFINPSPLLGKQVLEIGTATIRNYIELYRKWFNKDLSEYNLYLMPIGFVGAPGCGTAIPISKDESRLVSYLADLMKTTDEESGNDFHVALEVNLSFKRTHEGGSTDVRITDDPDAIEVTLLEEDIRRKYPWDYNELTERLRGRYIDFKSNKKYHTIRKSLKNDSRYVRSRYLDPGNPRSLKKEFYNPNIIQVFDRHYTRK